MRYVKAGQVVLFSAMAGAATAYACTAFTEPAAALLGTIVTLASVYTLGLRGAK